MILTTTKSKVKNIQFPVTKIKETKLPKFKGDKWKSKKGTFNGNDVTLRSNIKRGGTYFKISDQWYYTGNADAFKFKHFLESKKASKTAVKKK